ncbi:MAG: transposase family protein [Bacteroidales bacterium]|jgi:transposase|nr:transposase family protein [Bacteroidales bacterium]MCI2145721.1 transposase family protein [Bacteroidales bacterium]
MNGFAKNSEYCFFNTLLQLPGIIINDVHVEESRIIIMAQTKEKYGTCPLCGKRSHRIHSVYCRTLQDLPVCAREVFIKLQIKKFVCTNPRCKKKVFSQRLPSGIRRYSRRTGRAEEQLTQLSLEVSGRKGSWISKLIC